MEVNIMEERLISIENTVGQLVKMVSTVLEQQNNMRQDIEIMKADIEVLKTDIRMMKADIGMMQADIKTLQNDQKNMRETSDERYNNIMEELKMIRADHNHTWEKVVRNERKIALMETKI